MRTMLMKSMFVTGLLCSTALLPAISRADVVDDAAFFSADAVTAANDAIRTVEKKTGHKVRIETHATVPADKVEAVSKMAGPDREKFFSNWLHDRAEATKSRGLIVLICKEPAHLRLWAGTPLQNAGFGAVQAKQIREPLLAGFKAKEYDKALKESVTHITTVLEGLTVAKASSAAPLHHPSNQQSRPQPHQQQPHAATGVGYGGLLTVLAIVIGGVFVFSMIARMFGGGGGYAQNPAGYGPGPGYGGGGGFMQSLAGGIFGAVAGNWLYNQFSGHQAHGSDSWTNTDSTYGGDSGSSISDSGFSGGTDFGGGDFGGGDAGGGDFGGGGDF